MPSRACVFVDGENFRYSIADLFPAFHKQEYLPKGADWSSLFDWIVKEVKSDGDRIRAYWYVIKTIDFFPYSFPFHPDSLRRLLSRHQPYKADLDAISDDVARELKMKTIVEDLNRRQQIMDRRFDGWIKMQDGIASRHKAIEFRRAGAIKCDLFTFQLGQEKAVDVKLASDLIMLKDVYDVAIIVSGDQDYVPAVEIIKDFGKRVVNIAFETRDGRLLPGGARRLNQVTDWSIILKHDQLATYLGLRPHLLGAPPQKL